MKKALLSLCIGLGLIGISEAQTTGDVLIQNATVLTITNGTLENTDVLIEDGKIRRIGQDLREPRDAEVIDATGLYVMPGIIDAHSHIAGTSINEGTAQVTAEVDMGDVVNPMLLMEGQTCLSL